jgi:hypothetical protein
MLNHKEMKLRISITAIVCLLAVSNVSAQDQAVDKVMSGYHKHEISAALAVDILGINCKLESGVHRVWFGGNFGVEYAYNINSRIALRTGVDVSFYNGKIDIDDDILSGEYTAVGASLEEFVMQYSLRGGYNEHYNVVMLAIPLMMKYNTPFGTKYGAKYYIAGGLKIGIPLTATSTIVPGNYTTKAYYAYENCTYFNTGTSTIPNKYGIGSWSDNGSYDSNIELVVTPMLAFETGVRIPIKRSSIYAGMYLDYGLRSMQKLKTEYPIEYQYQNPGTLVYNSILNTAVVKKMSIISIGLKVGIGISGE